MYLSERPCNVSEILEDLVGVATPLANKQKRIIEFHQYSLPHVAVDESALRQALGNLIEGSLLRTNIGGKVQIMASKAPSGGALIVIDDDGPDMHYMVTQFKSFQFITISIYQNYLYFFFKFFNEY